MLSWNDVIALRMERQYLSKPAGREEYDQLFIEMSPVPTMYWTRPGDPPTLPGHTEVDDYDYNSGRRARREILKGRFAGGTVAYVTKEDLEVFACLYRKEIGRCSSTQSEIIELFRQEGPMNIQLLKELTGLLVKAITPQLHKLQEAFVVYEDQLDNEWDRGWYLFEGEFPEVDLNRYSRKEALKKLLPRAIRLLVLAEPEQLKSYYRLPAKMIEEALGELTEEGILVTDEVNGRKGYLLKEDMEHHLTRKAEPARPGVLLLQKNDFLSRAYADQMKKTFVSEWASMYYLLIDGEFHGIVAGTFKFGPHVIEDILLDLTEEEKLARRDEILEAVYQVFDKEASPVNRYCGVRIG